METEQREQKTNVNKQKKENKMGDGDFLRGRLSVFTSHYARILHQCGEVRNYTTTDGQRKSPKGGFIDNLVL